MRLRRRIGAARDDGRGRLGPCTRLIRAGGADGRNQRHAQLASTELSGESDEPVQTRMTQRLDITGLSEAELNALESALRKTTLLMEQSN